MISGKNEASLEDGLNSSAKAGNVLDGTPADSGASRPEARSAYQVLIIAMKDHCFVRDAAYNALEDLYELKPSCALSGKVSVVHAASPHRTRKASGQASTDYVVFAKNDVEDALRFISRAMASGAHGFIFFPTLCSFTAAKASVRE